MRGSAVDLCDLGRITIILEMDSKILLPAEDIAVAYFVMRPVATRHVRLALRCYKSQGGLIPPRLKIFPARPVILNYLEQDFGPCIMLWPLGGLFQATASPGSLLLDRKSVV